MSDAARGPDAPPIVATGWLLWLTWLYVAVFSVPVLFELATVVLGRNALGAMFGVDVPGMAHVRVLWLAAQVPYIAFAIGCVGLLLHDRDFAWVAVVAAWVIAVLQMVQAFLQLFHLRLAIPISAVIFAAFAVRTTRLLRPPRHARPLTGRGTL